MALGKQAKVLSDQQIKAVLFSLERSRNGTRNKVMFLLSLHGLRAKEIANLELSMLTDAEGSLSDAIALQDKASKGNSGRTIYMNKALKSALADYLQEKKGVRRFVISTERSEQFSANAIAVFFKRLYSQLGFVGASSHSGRRTFITNASKKISMVGGSLKDVMQLAGHKHLSTTQRYIDQDVEAQRKIISVIY